MSKPQTAMTVAEKQQNLKSMLLKALPAIQGIASKMITPERLVRISLVAASRRPELLNCTPQSLLSALLAAAQVGLEPETPLAHAYLVPFKNKNGTLEATFMPSAKGLSALARRSGDLANSWARVVYEGELFEVEEGLEPRLLHKPNLDEDGEGKMVATYAVAVLKDGTRQFEVMSAKQIAKIRASSRAGNSGPWVDWTEMMWRKTVLKRLLRQLPIDNEQVAAAIGHDDDAERGDARAFADIVPMEIAETASRTEQVKKDLKAAKPAEGAPATGPTTTTITEEEAAEIKRQEAEEAARERDGH